MRTVTTRSLTGVAVLVGAVGLALPAAPAVASDDARIHLVNGLPGAVLDVSVDGRVVADDLAAATVATPVDLPPGPHLLEVRSTAGPVATATLDLAGGSVQDVVVHLPVSGATPVVTSFADDLAPVADGKARLVVTHTAAVPPADIVVDGQVLFANVANGESLTAEVPAGTYRVQVVATGRTSPSFLGPLDLAVQPGALNRVYAIGDPDGTGMDAVVNVVAVGTAGSPAPGRVDTGSGGQLAGLGTGTVGWFGASG